MGLMDKLPLIGNRRKDGKRASKGRVVTVGWFMNEVEASFIYEAPQRMESPKLENASDRAVQACPAIIDFESRLFWVPCPFDAVLHLQRLPDGTPHVVDLTSGKGGLSPKALSQLIHHMPPNTWRHPDRPVIQMVTPYRFLSDDFVYINQMPPFNHYFADPWPGLLISGRFPIDVWPRSLMWAFEWHDTSKSVVLKRGMPWFYAGFDTIGPDTPVRLVKAQVTPELQQYCKGLDHVTSFVNQTFSVFDTARKRRPRNLLKIDTSSD